MQCCALCNETIEDILLEFGEFVETDGEYWHLECHAEYFGEELQEV